MRERLKNYVGVKVTDTDVRRLEALRTKLNVENDSEVLRELLRAGAKRYKVEVPA
jgi:hypothetical protein